METIFVLLPMALLVAAIAVGFFVWAAKSGQFDDLDTPPVRMLFDDPPSPPRGSGEARPSAPLHDTSLTTAGPGSAKARLPRGGSE